MQSCVLVWAVVPKGITGEVGGVFDRPDPLASSWICVGRAVREDRASDVDGGITPVHGDPVVTVAAVPARWRR